MTTSLSITYISDPVIFFLKIFQRLSLHSEYTLDSWRRRACLIWSLLSLRFSVYYIIPLWVHVSHLDFSSLGSHPSCFCLGTFSRTVLPSIWKAFLSFSHAWSFLAWASTLMLPQRSLPWISYLKSPHLLNLYFRALIISFRALNTNCHLPHWHLTIWRQRPWLLHLPLLCPDMWADLAQRRHQMRLPKSISKWMNERGELFFKPKTCRFKIFSWKFFLLINLVALLHSDDRGNFPISFTGIQSSPLSFTVWRALECTAVDQKRGHHG